MKRKKLILLALVAAFVLLLPFMALMAQEGTLAPADDPVTRVSVEGNFVRLPSDDAVSNAAVQGRRRGPVGETGVSVYLAFYRASGVFAETQEVRISDPAEAVAYIQSWSVPLTGESGMTAKQKIKRRWLAWLQANGKISGVTIP